MCVFTCVCIGHKTRKGVVAGEKESLREERNRECKGMHEKSEQEIGGTGRGKGAGRGCGGPAGEENNKTEA